MVTILHIPEMEFALPCLRAVAGRGRKISPWSQALFGDLLSEFERLRAAGFKFSASVQKTHALVNISRAPEEYLFHRSVVYKLNPLPDQIPIRWVEHFM